MSLIVNPRLNNTFPTWTEIFFNNIVSVAAGVFTTCPSNFYSPIISSNGNTIILGFNNALGYNTVASYLSGYSLSAHMSTDGGLNWTTSPNMQIGGNYINRSGIVKIYANGNKSFNNNWSSTNVDFSRLQNAGDVIISDDGLTIIGITSSKKYVLKSTDGGITFSNAFWDGIYNIDKITMSGNAAKVALLWPIGNTYDSRKGLIEGYSNNYANPDWSIGLGISAVRYVSSLSMSQNGQIITATLSPVGGIYTSHDGGYNWFNNFTTSEQFVSSSISEDGSFQVAVSKPSGASSKVFHSYDAGVTWNQVYTWPNLDKISISGNGKKQALVQVDYSQAGCVTGNNSTVGKVCRIFMNNNYGL